jgi:hypothetical protein
MSTHPETPNEPIRLSPGRKRSVQQTIILLLALTSGCMVAIAIPNLIDGSFLSVLVKSALLALAGTTVAYGVNRLAVERGAPLATKGYSSAAVASVLSIGIVGAGLFVATFSGFVFKPVSELKLEAHGAQLQAFVDQRAKAAAQAGRILPAVNAVAVDLRSKRDCEIQVSCISGSGGGGRGPVSRTIDEKLGRTESIAVQVSNGGAARPEIVARIGQLLSQYQAIAQSNETDVLEKWPALRRIDSQIKQATSELDEAMPVALASAYATELAGGAEISGRPEASRQLTSILRGHAATLKTVIASAEAKVARGPDFPSKAGVSDTLNYIGHFAPIAAITGVVELVFPLVLWIYTFLTFRWAGDRISPREPARLHEEDEAVLKLFARPELPGDAAADDSFKRPSPKITPRSNDFHGPAQR